MQWFIYFLPCCKFSYWFNYIKCIVFLFLSRVPLLHILFYQSCLLLLPCLIILYFPSVCPHIFFLVFLSRKFFTLCLFGFFSCKFSYWFNYIKCIVFLFLSRVPLLHILFYQSCLLLLPCLIILYFPSVCPHIFFLLFLSRKFFTLCLFGFFSNFVILQMWIYYI